MLRSIKNQINVETYSIKTQFNFLFSQRRSSTLASKVEGGD